MIESVSFDGGPSVTIKSHHNVGGLPERMKMKLVEPLRELFKDEVRVLGRELGLPEAFVGRHPFPGPGLAIRIPGEVTKERCDILRKADAIYLEEIRKAGLYDTIWQAFAVLLPVRTVGVMGDHRTYGYPLVIRAVSSEDAMTADWSRIPHKNLERISSRIIGEVKQGAEAISTASTDSAETILGRCRITPASPRRASGRSRCVVNSSPSAALRNSRILPFFRMTNVLLGSPSLKMSWRGR